MEKQVSQIMAIIEWLPVEAIAIIGKKCTERADISPKVQKLLDLFESLEPEEQQQFFSNANTPVPDDIATEITSN